MQIHQYFPRLVSPMHFASIAASSSTAACSMRRSTVHRSARHCRAYAQRPRTDSWPAYLNVLPTCTSVAISPPSHRIVNIRCRQGRAYAGIGCDCRFAARPTSCTSDRPAWARGCGWRQAWYRLAREAVCWWALYRKKEVNAGNILPYADKCYVILPWKKLKE